MTLSRRHFAQALVAGLSPVLPPAFSQVAAPAKEPAAALAAVEAQLGGRLGVVVLDTGAGRRWAHRPDERFPMCSVFKAIAGAAVLAQVDAGREDLMRRVLFERSALVTWSPVTETRVGGDGMTLGELCDAAVTRSDNTAGNLLLQELGGPAGLTAFMRRLGDTTSRLDRWEPALNAATPGDPRDTTTPAAMAANFQALLLGPALSPGSRDQLASWLVGSRTGGGKLRAGLPPAWRFGDKTGAGEHGTMNDVAIAWPPGRAPLIVSAFITQTDASFDQRNAALAEVGRIAVSALGA
jgi:beta-lactamase class A